MSTDDTEATVADASAEPQPQPEAEPTVATPEGEAATQSPNVRGLKCAVLAFAASLVLAMISGVAWSSTFAQGALMFSALGVSGMIASLGGIIILTVRDWGHVGRDVQVGLLLVGTLFSLVTVLAALILADTFEDHATTRSQTAMTRAREHVLSGEPIDLGEGMRLVAEARMAGKPLVAFDYMETGYATLRTLFVNDRPSRTFVMAIGADRACQLIDAPFSIVGWEDDAVVVELRGRTPECQGASVLRVNAKRLINQLVKHQIARDVMTVRNAEAHALPDDVTLVNRLMARRAPAPYKS